MRHSRLLTFALFLGLAVAAPADWTLSLSQALSRPDVVRGLPGLDKERSAVMAVRQRAQARLGADGTAPPNALWRAKLQRDALLAAQGEEPALSALSWTNFGPGNIGGRIRAILIHPTDPNTMWLGSVGGGVWKSVNAGGSWVPMDDFLPALSIGCMELDPNDPNVLYAGTGEGFFETVEGSSNTAALRGAGIFRSTDGGTTWAQIPSTAGIDFQLVNRLAIDPRDSNRIMAATSTGLFRSIDRGQTWQKTFTGWVYDLKLNPNNPDQVVAGLHAGAGVIHSSDNGVTWGNSTGITGAHRCELDWSKSANGTVYAGVSANERIRIFRSTDFGRTWTLRTSGSGVSTYESYNSALWVDPTNANNLVVGGVFVYRSTDGGVTVPRVFNAMHPDFHVIVEAPGYDGSTNRRVYFGHDGGISVATNVYGSTYTDLNNNLGITQFYGVAVNDATGVIVAGAQDNGTLRYTGNVNTWSDRIGGDGIFCGSDPTNPNYFYGGYYYNRIFRSSDGGANFSDISTGITDRDSSTNSNFIAYFTLDPNDPNRMLACGRRLWRSNTVKGTPGWTIIKQPIALGPGDGPGDPPNAHMNSNPPQNISTCTIARGNSNLIWVGHNNGQLWKTTNGTAGTPSWTRVDGGVTPGRWVGRIVIDPNDTNRVYVAFMGWEGDNVWRTTDGGATWQQATGVGARKLPAAPVSALAVDPARPGRLFAGTDVGLFTTWDDGQTWSVESQGPGTVSIDELVWRNPTTLVAATHGRGVWQANVTPGANEASPESFTIARGVNQGGGLAELTTSDDAYLNVGRGLVLNQQESPVTVEFSTTARTSTAQSIEVTLELGANTAGLQQTIQARDTLAGAWVEVDRRNASLSDLVTTVTLPGSASRFVDGATRRVRLRALVRQTGPTTLLNWFVRFDLVRWRIVD